MKLYRVGGCVRDKRLGRRSSDIDYSVEAESYEAMKAEMLELGFKIFLETPEFFTIRARFPEGKETADFVLCRKDGDYSDGRHPDEVFVGTIYDDLARRDFTMNAIAEDEETGEVIDPHGGEADIDRRLIRCVGDPVQRFEEDYLRMLRAIRFAVQLGFQIDPETSKAIEIHSIMLSEVKIERVYVELRKAFEADTIQTVNWLNYYSLWSILFSSPLKLAPSLKGYPR